MIAIETHIDHPMQSGPAFYEPRDISRERSDALDVRFEGSGVDVNAVIAELERATTQVVAYRMTEERMNYASLELGPAEEISYKRLAGVPEKTGEYIRWFGLVTRAAFSRTIPKTYADGESQEDEKLGLELGGTRQEGDWSLTRQLDVMARSIPRQLMASEAGARIDVINRQRADRKYQFSPHFIPTSQAHEFDFGVVRRRRKVADVYLPSSERTVGIFKEARALVVLSQLSEADRAQIRQDYRNITDQRSLDRTHNTNSRAGGTAGRAFERAIASRGETTELVPVSAHYVMMAKRSGATALEEFSD